MIKKTSITIFVLLIASIYATFIISSSFKTGRVYHKIEQVELLEEDKIIPKLYFEGDISKMSKATGERPIKVKYKDKNHKFNAYATIKIQGNSSAYYDKKNYNIKFYKDENNLEKFKIDLGWGRENKYVLKANWVDKTHTRNIACANIIATVNKKYNLFVNTPNYGMIDGYPVEVYLNDEFHGLYTLNIPKDEWLLSMDDKNENHVLIAAESWSATNLFKEEANFSDWECEVGQETPETLDKINRIIRFVNNSSDKEFKSQFENYFNVDATINYYILTQVFHLADNTGKNQLLATYDGNVWYPILYDLDTAFGTQYDGKYEYDYNQILKVEDNKLYKRLSENFQEEILARYKELRKTLLTEKFINQQIDYFYYRIPQQTITKEYEKWGPEIPGYEISQMKKFIEKRLPIIDKHFEEKFSNKTITIQNF